jgi:hypothetical protein
MLSLEYESGPPGSTNLSAPLSLFFECKEFKFRMPVQQISCSDSRLGCPAKAKPSRQV